MLVRYSKPVRDIASVKSNFFDSNDEIQRRLDLIADVYLAQPRRKSCKKCDAALSGLKFKKKNIGYTICDRCGHLNGDHDDTTAFCVEVYTEQEGENYSAAYLEKSRLAYRNRVDSIYKPKAEFLFDGLTAAGHRPLDLRYADIGAGAGYFVSALKEAGAQASGFDVSLSQARFAQAMDENVSIVTHDLAETESIVREIDSDVVSMIGVLEHLQEPRKILNALRENTRVNFVYLSLPLFSSSVAIESVFPDVMQRQLAGGHTHLYTEQSIRWFCDEFGLTPVAEWWFGTDIMDLFRSVEVMLRKAGDSDGLLDYWRRTFAPAIDDLQSVLDRRRMASEVHILFRKSA